MTAVATCILVQVPTMVQEKLSMSYDEIKAPV